MYCRMGQPKAAGATRRSSKGPNSVASRIAGFGSSSKAKPSASSASSNAAASTFKPAATCTGPTMICDQPDAASATALTYTGNGLSYNGVPLVQAPDTGVLTASSDPACQSPGGGVMTFPKGKPSAKIVGGMC